MIVSRLILRNWKNFLQVDVPLEDRVFLVGPNASGKSNLLDAFHFMKDLVSPGGGLYRAVVRRGGFPLLRSLAAPKNARVGIEFAFAEGTGGKILWRYALDLKPYPGHPDTPMVARERVWREGRPVLDRPDEADRADRPRLRQTCLEGLITNAAFRDIADFFEASRYFHLIPHQFRRDDAAADLLSQDFSRHDFFRRVAAAPRKTREARFRKIEEALKLSVPLFKDLRLRPPEEGEETHIESSFSHWKENSPYLREDRFSDGILRLIGILWSLLERSPLLLLEEPELSLNTAVVRQLPGLIHRLRRGASSQVILSTHSPALLSDTGIDGKEVVLLLPAADRSIDVARACDLPDVEALLETGVGVGDVVLPRTQPARIEELGYFQ